MQNLFWSQRVFVLGEDNILFYLGVLAVAYEKNKN